MRNQGRVSPRASRDDPSAAPDRSGAEGKTRQQVRIGRWSMVLAGLGLGYLVCSLFHPVSSFEFIILDVPQHLIDHPYVQNPSWENLKLILTRRCITSYYPFRTLTYAMDQLIWRGSPGGFKLTNVAFHLSNVILLYWLILRLYRHMEAEKGTGPIRRNSLSGASHQSDLSPFPKPWWEAFAAALPAGLLAVHPVVVETVVWVAGREELLMTLGALGCFHCYVTAHRVGEEPGRRRQAAAWYTAAVVCAALACMSNAVAAIIPFLITAWDAIVLPRPKRWKIVRRTWALWLIGAATVTVKVGAESNEAAIGLPPLFTSGWVMLIFNLYWLDLKTLAWPVDLIMNYPLVRPESFLEPGVYLGIAAAAATFLALWAFRRRKLFVFGLVWFGLALGPTLQILPHHFDRADRFLYLPLVGLAIATAAALRPLGGLLRSYGAFALVAVGVMSLVLLKTFSSDWVATWKDNATLWTHCLDIYPENDIAHCCLAEALTEAGHLELGLPHYQAALRLRPRKISLLHNYATRLAEAENENLRDFEFAIELARRACEVSRWRDPKTREGLSLVHTNYGHSLKEKGKYREAVDQYELAIHANPSDAVPYLNLAMLLAACDDPAIRQPDKAVKLAEGACRIPEGPELLRLVVLSRIYEEVGQIDKASETARRAIEVAQARDDTRSVEALRNQLKGYRAAAAAAAGSPAGPSEQD